MIFKRQQPGISGEIDVTGFSGLARSKEFLRMWSPTEEGSATCFVQPENLAADPFTFGMAMVDAVKHAARAWSQAVNITEAEALARIFEGFDAERGHPTDEIKQIN